MKEEYDEILEFAKSGPCEYVPPGGGIINYEKRTRLKIKDFTTTNQYAQMASNVRHDMVNYLSYKYYCHVGSNSIKFTTPDGPPNHPKEWYHEKFMSCTIDTNNRYCHKIFELTSSSMRYHQCDPTISECTCDFIIKERIGSWGDIATCIQRNRTV